MRLTLAAFILFMTNAFPGGVTVGNGTGKVIVGVSVKHGFQNESDLLTYSQSLIYDINGGVNPRVEKMIQDGQCKTNYRSVKKLATETFIPIVDGDLGDTKEYIGYLLVELDQCKKIEHIKADMPFGGYEFWDL